MKCFLSLSKPYTALNPEERQRFDKWFGKSVVRTGSEPKVVFHGTKGDFSAFDPKHAADGYGEIGIGFYFADDPRVASGYADGGSVLPCYIRLLRPINANSQPLLTATQARALVTRVGPTQMRKVFSDFYDGTMPLQQMISQYVEGITGSDLLHGAITIFHDFYKGSVKASSFAKIFSLVTRYDGVIRRYNGGSIYAVFTPNQIKSAIGNSGNYRRVPNIMD